MTQAHLDLLRRMAVQAQQADMDVGLGANVLIALLDEIERLPAAINDKLEEVAVELKKLEEGVYTTAQTPAGLVRAMKVT